MSEYIHYHIKLGIALGCEDDNVMGMVLGDELGCKEGSVMGIALGCKESIVLGKLLGDKLGNEEDTKLGNKFYHLTGLGIFILFVWKQHIFHDFVVTQQDMEKNDSMVTSFWPWHLPDPKNVRNFQIGLWLGNLMTHTLLCARVLRLYAQKGHFQTHMDQKDWANNSA
eukprot:7596304-Ditylum_brightwellii.AAC.1